VSVAVVVVNQPSNELLDAMHALVPQLSTSAHPMTMSDLGEVVTSPGTTFFVASDDTGILGTLTLVIFRIPTGVRAWIEDVIVDEGSRGLGVGEALTLAAIERARDGGATSIDLTSRPSREAANRLYQRMGFERRETNVYRLQFQP
jgi:ribosomal protein S18 acetylase RimI-like enzyme